MVFMETYNGRKMYRYIFYVEWTIPESYSTRITSMVNKPHWTFTDTFLGNLNQNTNIFFQENAYETVACVLLHAVWCIMQTIVNFSFAIIQVSTNKHVSNYYQETNVIVK